MNPYLDFKIRGNMNGIKYPCLCDVKYDGICVSIKADGPIIVETKDRACYGILPDTEANNCKGLFLAEWVHGSGANGKLYELMAAKSDPERLKETDIRIFDVIEMNGKRYANKSLLERRNDLIDTFIRVRKRIVESIICENAQEVEQFFNNVTALGYEGIVVKNLDETLEGQTWVKMKKEDIVTVQVIKDEENRFEVLHGNTAVGLAYNTAVHSTAAGDIIQVKHNGVFPNGSLRNPVAVGFGSKSIQ